VASNLWEQGYARVISVLIAFEWSESAAGAPWDRVDGWQPPLHDGALKWKAVFLLERATRRNRGGALDRRRVCRSGPIALTEPQVLGSQIPAAVRATLLGRALTVEYSLDPVEREILHRLEKAFAVSGLVVLLEECSMQKNAILAAIDSLQSHGLVSVTLQPAANRLPYGRGSEKMP
jgi:hypothetical protein